MHYVKPLFKGFTDSTEDWSIQIAMYGLISFGLTIINIACIILVGYFTLKVKQVAPNIMPHIFLNFWKSDVQAHNDQERLITQKSVTSEEPLDRTPRRFDIFS